MNRRRFLAILGVAPVALAALPASSEHPLEGRVLKMRNGSLLVFGNPSPDQRTWIEQLEGRSHRWERDPVAFAEEALGVHLEVWQREAIRTSVHSGLPSPTWRHLNRPMFEETNAYLRDLPWIDS